MSIALLEPGALDTLKKQPKPEFSDALKKSKSDWTELVRAWMLAHHLIQGAAPACFEDNEQGLVDTVEVLLLKLDQATLTKGETKDKLWYTVEKDLPRMRRETQEFARAVGALGQDDILSLSTTTSTL